MMSGLEKSRKNKVTASVMFAALVSIGIMGLLKSSAVFAREVPQVKVTEHTIQLGDEYFDLTFEQSINPHNEREVAVYHDEIRKFLPDTRVAVLYGRDTNADGHYDAWFKLGKGGVDKVYEQNAMLDDGWDAVYKLLRANDFKIKDRWLLAVAIKSIPNLTFSGASNLVFFNKMDRAQMDLLDMEIRVGRMAKLNKKNPLISTYYQYIGESWQMLAQEVDQHMLWWAPLTVVDATIGNVAPVIWGRMRPLFDKIAVKVVESSLGQWAGTFYLKWIESALSLAKSGAIRMLSKTPIPAYSQKTAAFVFKNFVHPVAVSGLSLEHRMHYGIRALSDRAHLGKGLAKLFKTAVRSAGAGASQWKYIGQTALVQLMAEVAARSDTLFNANPIVLTQNVANDKDLLQNLAYMTNETFLLSGVSTAIKNEASALRICGVVATVDSVAMSYLIKGEVDPVRGVFDTSWERVMGVFQTKLDLFALAKFEELAVQQKNPKLKLVGYAVAFVEQLGGYYGYSKATQNIDRLQKDYEKKPMVRFIPIMAPTN